MEYNQLEMDLLCIENTDDDDSEFDLYEVYTSSGINEHLRRAFAMAIDIQDDERKQSIIIPEYVDDSHWDQVVMFQRDVDARHCVAVPDYACVHSPRLMFSLVDYRSCLGAGLVDDYEHWRSFFNRCTFSPFVHVTDDTPDHYRRDSSIMQEHFGNGYICPHKDRGIGNILRTRPTCCDQGCRSLCWIDLNLTFHRSISSVNVGMPLCINAPVKGFQVYSLTQHPGYRIREMFHFGKSTTGGEEMLSEIDSYACKEVYNANCIMRKLMSIPALWCHTFDYLNPHEKMIFTSMLLDADGDNIEHFANSVRMYGFSASHSPYSLYYGHKESDMTDITSLRNGMSQRVLNPRKQMMKHANEYDIVNTINRHATRVVVMCEWADLLYRLMHSVGGMVSGGYHDLIDDVHRIRLGQPFIDSIEDHRHRHHRYIMGLYSVYEVLYTIAHNPRPTAVLRLFDRIIRAHHNHIYQGHTLAHVIYEITAEECPMRHDLYDFFESIEWNFNKFKGISPPSSVGVFLLQLLKISSIEMTYFEFLMSEFSSSIVFDSCVCGCDKKMLDDAFVVSHKIRDMIQNLK